ncbi:MAG: hypothetical protein E8D43_00105 [Nitrospira sp.]|nr:MAG: hypothetical protein E8D43_00105 [Nitrospira sp.]
MECSSVSEDDMKSLQQWIICVGLTATLPLWAVGQDRTSAKPLPPSEEIPDLSTVKPTIVCGNCDQPFDPTTHKGILKGLASNRYVGELRRALYWQDSYHQFESKVHFDNCDFDEAVGYVDSLLAEVDRHVVEAKVAHERGDQAATETSALKAFFALGQALHGVQDFYAHTNYVEMSVDQARKSTDIVIVSPWTQSGKNRIKELESSGLVSGYVSWGFPKKCPNGTPTHADMAKDKATTPSGAVKVPHLENRSRYQISVQLARGASQELMDYAFRRWPLLKEVNGQYAAFEVLVDSRGL